MPKVQFIELQSLTAINIQATIVKETVLFAVHMLRM